MQISKRKFFVFNLNTQQYMLNWFYYNINTLSFTKPIRIVHWLSIDVIFLYLMCFVTVFNVWYNLPFNHISGEWAQLYIYIYICYQHYISLLFIIVAEHIRLDCKPETNSIWCVCVWLCWIFYVCHFYYLFSRCFDVHSGPYIYIYSIIIYSLYQAENK